MNWQYFLENKEKEEEKHGLDVDHDQEHGESKIHRDKVKQAKKKTIAFFRKRQEGARKIARQAHDNQLTQWHFEAKNQPYDDVIQAIQDDKSKSYFLSKCKTLHSRIRCGSMSQENFQKVMGELEVWGETVAYLFE